MSQKRTLRLVTDCDGVLFDFVGAMIRHTDYDRKWSHEDISSWGFFPQELINENQRHESFCRNVQPIIPAVRMIHNLRRRGWEITFATAKGVTPPTWRQVRSEVVHELFGAEVHFIDNKLTIEADMIVDDYAKNLTKNSVNAQQEKILLLRPWSDVQLLRQEHNVKIATSYKEIEIYAGILERTVI